MAAVTGVALLAGCTPLSSGPDASASATPSTEPTTTVLATAPAGTPDPCAMIGAERASEILGTEMSAGEFDAGVSSDGRNICEWRPANEEKSEPRLQVEVNWAFPDAAEHRALAEEVFGATSDLDREIEGASDVYTSPGRRTLGMTVGDYFVKVSYIKPKAKKKVALNACVDAAREIAAGLSA